VNTRIGSPTSVINSPAPVEISVTSATNQNSPIAKLSTRKRKAIHVRGKNGRPMVLFRTREMMLHRHFENRRLPGVPIVGAAANFHNPASRRFEGGESPPANPGTGGVSAVCWTARSSKPSARRIAPSSAPSTRRVADEVPGARRPGQRACRSVAVCSEHADAAAGQSRVRALLPR
jgi:hypothetical protein